jgi:hypothetical protein
MALVKDMIQSKYLRKEDFDQEGQTCTIKGVKQENLGKDGQEELRWILFFRDAPVPKGMVMNITTIRVLEQSYGGDTDKWIGNPVIVYVDPNVSMAGKVVGGLRLRIPKQKAAPKPAAAPTLEDDLDDVPF